jgi:hypothetical protein
MTVSHAQDTEVQFLFQRGSHCRGREAEQPKSTCANDSGRGACPAHLGPPGLSRVAEKVSKGRHQAPGRCFVSIHGVTEPTAAAEVSMGL